MRDNMCLLSTIQRAAIERVVDLVAKLVASELDAPRWVKLGHQNGESLRPEVLSHSAKVLNTEFFAEPENSMNQNEIHKLAYLNIHFFVPAGRI